MPFIPVIERELRASSRQPFTYWLRAISVSALLLASFLFGVSHGFEPNLGSALFSSLHFTLFCAIWILVPLLTADCISRERREGTLGLLFLTRLKGPDIVVAKSVAHGLRALTLWVSVMPIVALPFMLGGLSRMEIVLSLLIDLSSMCWALSAGLLGSVCSKTWTQAIFRAGIMAAFFLLLIGAATGMVASSLISSGGALGTRLSGSTPTIIPMDIEGSLDYTLALGLGFLSNVSGTWQRYFLRLVTLPQMFGAMLQVVALSAVVLALSILIAGARTRRIWQEQPPSAQKLWLQKTFTTPIIGISFFKRWMLHKLERNPIGWLEQRTWTGRVITWGWFAIIISLYSAVFTDRNFFRGYNSIQHAIGWLLSGSLALSAAGSFRRERESGVLELLLVSPVGEAEILFGRLRGLWGQFFPAFAIFIGIWMYFDALLPSERDSSMGFFGISFFTLPVIGLYYSLRCRAFITAFLWTIMVGLVLPVALPGLLQLAWWVYALSGATSPLFSRTAFSGLWQFAFAILCWKRLYQRLVKRAFPLERGEAL
jgi:ABC-type transport system involved in multi-copper enzyme maturation permease subunit